MTRSIAHREPGDTLRRALAACQPLLAEFKGPTVGLSVPVPVSALRSLVWSAERELKRQRREARAAVAEFKKRTERGWAAERPGK